MTSFEASDPRFPAADGLGTAPLIVGIAGEILRGLNNVPRVKTSMHAAFVLGARTALIAGSDLQIPINMP